MNRRNILLGLTSLATLFGGKFAQAEPKQSNLVLVGWIHECSWEEEIGLVDSKLTRTFFRNKEQAEEKAKRYSALTRLTHNIVYPVYAKQEQMTQ